MLFGNNRISENMSFKSYILLAIIIANIICSSRAKNMCDVRQWYLRLIKDEVFDLEMNDEQLSLKYEIESLVLKASESKQTRIKDCTILTTYNGRLADLFKYNPLSTDTFLAAQESSETGISDDEKTKDSIIQTDTDIDSESTTELSHEEGDCTDLEMEDDIHPSEDLEDPVTPEIIDKDSDTVKSIDSNTEEHSTDTNNLVDATDEQTDHSDEFATRSIPFGVCWSFGCLVSDIFDVFNYENEQVLTHPKIVQDYKSNTTDKNVKTVKYEMRCPIGNSCTLQCYYVHLLSKKDFFTDVVYDLSFKLDTEDETGVHHVLQGYENAKFEPENSEKVKADQTSFQPNENIPAEIPDLDTKTISESVKQDDVKTEDKTKSTSVLHEQLKSRESESSVSTFEKMMEHVSDKYNNKLQNLELMILKLENKLLLEAMDKHNHSSTISKLENHILKLENELLKMNKNYQNLHEDSVRLKDRQNKYLKLAYSFKTSSKNQYLELPNHNSAKYELISQHQAKINELTEVLENQSRIIKDLKDKQGNLEEKTQLLQEIVLNQSSKLNSIMEYVQNAKNMNNIQDAQKTIEKDTVDDKKINEEEQKNNQNVIDQMDSILFDTKTMKTQVSDTLEENNEINNFEPNLDNINANVEADYKMEGRKKLITAWCPKENTSCPACYYPSVTYLKCIPFQRIVWSGNELQHQQPELDLPSVPVPMDIKEDVLQENEPSKDEQTPQSDDQEVNPQVPNNVDTQIRKENDSINRMLSDGQQSIEQQKYETSESIYEAQAEQEKSVEQKGMDETLGDFEMVNLDKYILLGYDQDGKPVLKSHEEVKHDINQENINTGELNGVNPLSESSETSTNTVDSLTKSSETTINNVDSLTLSSETATNNVDTLSIDSEGTNKDVDSLSENRETLTNNVDQLSKSSEVPTKDDDLLSENRDIKTNTAAMNIQEESTGDNQKQSEPQKIDQSQTNAENSQTNTVKEETKEGTVIDVRNESSNDNVNNGKKEDKQPEVKEGNSQINTVKEETKEGSVIDVRNESSNDNVNNEKKEDKQPEVKEGNSQTNTVKEETKEGKVIDVRNESSNNDVNNGKKEDKQPEVKEGNAHLAKEKPENVVNDVVKENEAKVKENIKVKDTKPTEDKRKTPINLNNKNKPSEPRDCYDHYRRGERRDAIYKVKLQGTDRQIDVFCDMRRGGWTVIQRRQDGTINFFQDWDDYKKGFGGLYGEHWLGNDNIHLLTNQDYYKLRVDLMDWDKTKKYAEFDNFLVESEEEGYRLHVEGYTGDAGDGLTKHHGSKFSTKDVDNDRVVKEFGGSCAKRFYGAGWYYKCYSSNLNGRFYKGGKIPEKRFDGVTWKPWTGPNYSLKKVEMKIIPASVKTTQD